MSYLHLHLSTGVSSPSKTRRPTPDPPLKSTVGFRDRAEEGSAIGELKAVTVVVVVMATRRIFDSDFMVADDYGIDGYWIGTIVV